jgi:HEAT repeat protein
MRVLASLPLVLGFLGGCSSLQKSPFVRPDAVLEQRIRQRVEDLRFARGQELLEILRALTNAGEPAYEILLEGLEEDSPAVRAGCALVLGSSGDRRLLPHLETMREDPDPSVRYEVARALVRLGDWSGVPVLVGGMRDPSPVVRGLCHDTLREAAKVDFGFSPAGSPEEREAAVTRWEEWWSRRQQDPFFGR